MGVIPKGTVDRVYRARCGICGDAELVEGVPRATVAKMRVLASGWKWRSGRGFVCSACVKGGA